MQKIIDQLLPIIAAKYMAYTKGEFDGGDIHLELTINGIKEVITKKMVEKTFCFYGYKKGTEILVQEFMQMLNDDRNELTEYGINVLRLVHEELCNEVLERIDSGQPIIDDITYH